MRKKVKVKKTIYVLDEQDPIPKNKYLQSLFFQSKYQKGRINLNKEKDIEYLMDKSHCLGLAEQYYFIKLNPKGQYPHIGIYEINFLKEIIKYAEGLGYETLCLEQYQSTLTDTKEKPLIFTFEKEGIEVHLAPCVEDDYAVFTQPGLWTRPTKE